jgi:hypothetical protein
MEFRFTLIAKLGGSIPKQTKNEEGSQVSETLPRYSSIICFHATVDSAHTLRKLWQIRFGLPRRKSVSDRDQPIVRNFRN